MLLGNKFPEASYMLFSCAYAPHQTSYICGNSASCHRLRQMAKPVGTSIRKIYAALGAFGNVLNVRAKV